MKYSTKQKRAILEYMKAYPDRCFTVRELIAEGKLDVGEATVYRALSGFAADGEVKRYVSGDGGGALYQYASADESCESHFHLKCLSCGRLFHTECHVIDEMTKHVEEEHGFRVDNVHTTIYGYCRDCVEKGACKK